MLIEKKGVNTKSEEKGPQAMSNIICRTESDSLNTQQWYKRNKAEEDMATKAVILVGGPGKGTRFRPLSLDIPKPLFPIAGFPLVQHHIEACSRVEGLREILLIGFFQPTEQLNRFIREMKEQFNLKIRYLQEYALLGTAGSIYLFRDLVLAGNPESFFLIFCDILCDLPLNDMVRAREKWMKYMIMGVEVEPEQSLNYGCLGINDKTKEIVHYVEKPSSFVSNHINAGVYLLSSEVFDDISMIFKERYSGEDEKLQEEVLGKISLEHDILQQVAGTGKVFAFLTDRFWMSIKSAGSAIYANRVMLDVKQNKDLYNKYHPARLSTGDNLNGNVYIHPTAKVDPTAKIGPHVAIGANVVVHGGARIKNAMVLDGAVVKKHACLLNTIVGWGCEIGSWARVEGVPTELDPDRPHATTDNFYLFDTEGKLLPTITILGRDVTIPDEVIIRNSIVLPGKELTWGLNNQILL